MQKISHKIAFPLLFAVSSMSVLAEESPTSTTTGKFTGSLTVVNKYIYRGGVENDDVTVQAGLAYAHPSGFTLGYWGSTLGYDPSDSRSGKDHGLENDFYVAYGNQINQDWRYKVQTTAYYYQDGGTVYAENGDERKTTAVDVLGELSYKDLTLGTVVMLSDASFANAGDVYVSAAYSYALPQNFSVNTSVGASIYNSSRDNGLIETKNDVAFNEARLGVSKQFPKTGMTLFTDYVLGGRDRFDTHFDNQFVAGASFNF